MERENGFYRKKLMEIAMEGILSIQAGENKALTVIKLDSMVDIKDNPVTIACAKFITGDSDAIANIDFDSAIQEEGEREEIRFIKRAVALSEKARREGLLAFEADLDQKGIAARDVFEYGLLLIIGGVEAEYVEKILTMLISHETDPVQRHFAKAKQDAVLSIYAGENTRILTMKLLAYLDKSIADVVTEELLRD
jgi:flagellar motor component MotA